MILKLALAAILASPVAFQDEDEPWNRDVGKPAPELMSAGWVGTPVSLRAVRGNTVVIAFWNADIPC